MYRKKNYKSLDSIGERLVFLREMCLITRSELSKLSDMSYNTLKAWENTKAKKIKLDSAAKILKAFESLGASCTTEWLLYGEGKEPTFNQENHYQLQNNDNEENIYKELNYFKSINPNSVALLVTDTSMEPYYEPGDIVAGVKLTPETDHDKFINKICIIESIDGIKLIRHVSLGEISNTYNFSTLKANLVNFPSLSNMKLLYAAPVLWHRKKGAY